ncbi:unnamed protein product [Aspergillus oryzae var. brunneus]|uniref:Unnamed protein product n=2 Tax=Aspergillus oryzae TaxID=5062 RepID=A0AAN5BXU0_ASPOZ|nr:unnamed protein product [Aspergillus oryzae]GMG31033.1 unnamed protein product [Aspergillus oryzae]GMG42536.1 unnamed protein product [Aspergillus oryzae var. brunneus]
MNPKNIKAFYRSAMACLKLDKVDDAEDAAKRGLAIDPNNKSLQIAAEKAAERKAAIERVSAKRKAEEERKKQEKKLLDVALKAREIRTRTTDNPADLQDAVMHLVPDPLSPESTLEFPAVFLYPMDAQSDFIKAFSEMHSIEDHLEYIFPLPWDANNEYTIKSVDCFMETATGGLIKAGKKLPLLQILSGSKVEVVDQLVKFFIVPTAKSGQFIAEMKKRKQAVSADDRPASDWSSSANDRQWFTTWTRVYLPIQLSGMNMDLHAQAAGLHDAAVAKGLLYFGTATDNPELTNTSYVTQLNNTGDFGQITPGNSQKVRSSCHPEGFKEYEWLMQLNETNSGTQPSRLRMNSPSPTATSLPIWPTPMIRS